MQSFPAKICFDTIRLNGINIDHTIPLNRKNASHNIFKIFFFLCNCTELPDKHLLANRVRAELLSSFDAARKVRTFPKLPKLETKMTVDCTTIMQTLRQSRELSVEISVVRMYASCEI